jgi:hypothetical protein
MSPYFRAWLAWPSFLIVLFAVAAPLGLWLRREAPGFEPLAVLPCLLAAWWVGRGARCPLCGTSAFRAGRSVFSRTTAWPHRRCARCDQDLTGPR